MKLLSKILLILLFVACQKASKIPIPDVAIKPVFYAILKPNERIQVFLLQSRDNQFSQIPPNLSENSQIFVSDGIQEVALMKEAKNVGLNGAAFIDSNLLLNVSEGKTYSMRAIVAGKTYTATAKIPSKRLIIDKVNYSLSTDIIAVDFVDTILNARIVFKPNSEVDLNFYTELYLVKTKIENDSLGGAINFNTDKSLIEGTRDESNTIISSNFNLNWSSINSFGSATTEYKFLRAKVFAISPETYKFYFFANKSLFSGDSPFSEGVSTYTNIQGGGLGIFGSAVESVYYQPFTY
jgi:hypothetical protein